MSKPSRDGILIAACVCGLLGAATAPMMGIPLWLGFAEMAALGTASYLAGYLVG